MKFNRLHTVLVLLATADMEIACPNPEAPELKRHWIIRRTVDLNSLVWC